MKRKFTVEVVRSQSVFVDVEAENEDVAQEEAILLAANDSSFDKEPMDYAATVCKSNPVYGSAILSLGEPDSIPVHK